MSSNCSHCNLFAGDIISNVKHVHIYYIIIVYTPNLVFINIRGCYKNPTSYVFYCYI